jgi:hypothetical protein
VKLADAAKAFIEPKTWVEIAEEVDGAYKNLVEIIRAGSTPQLPGMEAL